MRHARRPPSELPHWLPVSVVDRLIAAASEALCAEESLVELTPPPGARVTVVGDTHGQLHDVLRLFEVAGVPSSDSLFILNGDYVDRRVATAPSGRCRVRAACAPCTCALCKRPPPHVAAAACSSSSSSSSRARRWAPI
jgi:hypothetical protein